MARSGDVIENPINKERIIFRQTASDTGGALLQYEDLLQAGGLGPIEHIHPYQEERVQVLSGAMEVRLDGRAQSVPVGQEVVIPPGAAHTWQNTGDDELHLRVELRPALRYETFIETVFGLARDGKTNALGVPNVWQVGVLYRGFGGEYILSRIPPIAQKGIFTVLGLVGRRLGYRHWYPQYSPAGPVELRKR